MRKELRDLQRLSGEDQSTVLRRLLEKGLSETKIEIAIDSYEGKDIVRTIVKDSWIIALGFS
jgi:hypothetical protein